MNCIGCQKSIEPPNYAWKVLSFKGREFHIGVDCLEHVASFYAKRGYKTGKNRARFFIRKESDNRWVNETQKGVVSVLTINKPQ